MRILELRGVDSFYKATFKTDDRCFIGFAYINCFHEFVLFYTCLDLNLSFRLKQNSLAVSMMKPGGVPTLQKSLTRMI
jgi:hypothetical protein